MSFPTPFEQARQAGNADPEFSERQGDKFKIGDILSQFKKSGRDSGSINDAMIALLTQVSPERQKGPLDFLKQRKQQLQQEEFLSQLPGAKRKRPQDVDVSQQEEAITPNGQLVEEQSNLRETPQGDEFEESLLDLSPEQRLRLQAINPDLSKSIENMIEQQRKGNIEERKYAQQELKDVKGRIQNIRNELPNTEFSLQMAEDAIEGATSWDGYADWLAQTTGLEGFRTRKGAELQSAIKQYFLGDLSSIKGGRPNQLIERQLLDAYPKMGRDPIANRKILLGMQAKESISRAMAEEWGKLEDKYFKKGRSLPANAEYILRKRLEPIAERIQKKTLMNMDRLNKLGTREYNRMRKNLKSNEFLMLNAEGEIYAVPKSQINEYKEKDWIKI